MPDTLFLSLHMAALLCVNLQEFECVYVRNGCQTTIIFTYAFAYLYYNLMLFFHQHFTFYLIQAHIFIHSHSLLDSCLCICCVYLNICRPILLIFLCVLKLRTATHVEASALLIHFFFSFYMLHSLRQ